MSTYTRPLYSIPGMMPGGHARLDDRNVFGDQAQAALEVFSITTGDPRPDAEWRCVPQGATEEVNSAEGTEIAWRTDDGLDICELVIDMSVWPAGTHLFTVHVDDDTSLPYKFFVTIPDRAL